MVIPNVDVRDDPAFDSMSIATKPIERGSNMQVNNESLNYDFGVEVDVHGDSDELEMEIPLNDDLCNAQMIARSVVANMQCSK